jgi:uncharacterized protein YecE (DUF72 family)
MDLSNRQAAVVAGGAEAAGDLFIGTQGFSFKDWVGSFYPASTASNRYLEQYGRQFSAVEIDSTFYGVPKRATVAGWRQRTPAQFRFAAKFPQIITHQRMLVDCDAVTRHFIDIMRDLGDKLGPLLLQFSYQFGPERFDDLARYLDELPDDLQFAVEIRDRDWYDTDIGAMLKARGVALAMHDLYYMPRRTDVTAGFVYIRWLGRRIGLERFDRIQLDRRDEESWWAEHVLGFLEQGLRVYGFFNNVWAGHAPASARDFLERLGQSVEPLEPEPQQQRLL